MASPQASASNRCISVQAHVVRHVARVAKATGLRKYSVVAAFSRLWESSTDEQRAAAIMGIDRVAPRTTRAVRSRPNRRPPSADAGDGAGGD